MDFIKLFVDKTAIMIIEEQKAPTGSPGCAPADLARTILSLRTLCVVAGKVPVAPYVQIYNTCKLYTCIYYVFFFEINDGYNHQDD